MRSDAALQPVILTTGQILALALHGILLVLLSLSLRPPLFEPLLEEAIEVALVEEPVPIAPFLPPHAPAPNRAEDTLAPAAPERQTEPPPGEEVRAHRMLSEGILASAASRQARNAFALLDAEERIEQICSLEAMSQVHAWKAEFEPDRVVAFAMEATRLTARSMQADGAALRSKQRWYKLRFTCELSTDQRQVVGFSFTLGLPVPRHEWQRLGLPALH